MDSTLTFEPATEAQRLAQPTFENALEAAIALAGQGDSETARVKFEEASELAGSLNSAEIWHRLCLEGGQWQQGEVALAACDKAIELEPENGQYYNSRAFVRQQLGDMAGAREDMDIFEQWLAEGEDK